jgi:hypothetical protein
MSCAVLRGCTVVLCYYYALAWEDLSACNVPRLFVGKTAMRFDPRWNTGEERRIEWFLDDITIDQEGDANVVL